MDKRITDLNVKQVPCKDKNFREYKITYKYKGKPISDFRMFDNKIHASKSDKQLKTIVEKQAHANLRNGGLVKYALKYTGVTRILTIASVVAGTMAVTAIVVPTTVILTRPYIEPNPEVTTIGVNETWTLRPYYRDMCLSYTLGDNIEKEPATVDWGDGTVQTLNSPSETLVHTYPELERNETKYYDIVFSGDVSSVSTQPASSTQLMYRHIVSVTFGKNITEIKSDSFKNLSELSSVYISSNVEKIESSSAAPHPFNKCIKLEKIHVNNQNKKYYSDRNDAALIEKDNKLLICGTTQAIIDKEVKEIGTSAFEGTVENIEELTIPSNVTKIGDKAFIESTTSTSKLKKITFSEGLKSIGNNVFSKSPIEELTLPNTLEEIGDSAFSNCKQLKKITMSQAIKNIGDKAFEECTSLDCTITLPASLNTIGEEAFAIPEMSYDNIKLNVVILNPNLQFTGKKTFDYCWFGALVTQTYHLTVPFINREAMVAKWGEPYASDYNTWMGHYFGDNVFVFAE